MALFKIDSETKNGIPLLKIEGDIDLHTCPELRSAVQIALQGSPEKLILDLSHVTYIDSTGLGVIALTAKQMSGHEGKIYAVCSQPHIRKVFELSGLQKKNVFLYDTHEVLNQIDKDATI